MVDKFIIGFIWFLIGAMVAGGLVYGYHTVKTQNLVLSAVEYAIDAGKLKASMDVEAGRAVVYRSTKDLDQWVGGKHQFDKQGYEIKYKFQHDDLSDEEWEYLGERFVDSYNGYRQAILGDAGHAPGDVWDLNRTHWEGKLFGESSCNCTDDSICSDAPWALEYLEAMGKHAEKSAPIVQTLLLHEDGDVRIAALECLHEIDPDHLSDYLDLLQEDIDHTIQHMVGLYYQLLENAQMQPPAPSEIP